MNGPDFIFKEVELTDVHTGAQTSQKYQPNYQTDEKYLSCPIFFQLFFQNFMIEWIWPENGRTIIITRSQGTQDMICVNSKEGRQNMT